MHDVKLPKIRRASKSVLKQPTCRNVVASFQHRASLKFLLSCRSISALPAFISNMTVEESFDTSVFVCITVCKRLHFLKRP